MQLPTGSKKSSFSNKTKFSRYYLIIVVVILVAMSVFSLLLFLGVIPNPFVKKEVLFGKPVIYLYPTQKQQISVTLNYKGTITGLYPAYNQKNGWRVEAYPNGDLIDLSCGKSYSYLFWEGIPTTMFTIPALGFVVKGSDTAIFLQEKLSYLGLTPKEYNEMIVYWLPKMERNKYNLVYFAGTDYTDIAKLTIQPKPDSILRIFMVFKPLNAAINIPQQTLKPFERKGFSVIEWGATELTN
jgi:hypothetical protein